MQLFVVNLHWPMLNRISMISRNWVKSGHIDGINTHNVSATVSLRDNEWEEVGNWLWDNREAYNGLSVLPYDGGNLQTSTLLKPLLRKNTTN